MKSLKKIKHLIEYWLLLMLFAFLRLLGLELSARLLAAVLWRCKNILTFSKTICSNLELVYNLSCDKQEQLLQEIYSNLGRFIAEIAIMQKMDSVALQNLVTINGMENIAHLTGKPYLIFTGHFANWEMVSCALTKIATNAAIVYRKINNPYIDAMMNKRRAQQDVVLIPKGPSGAKILLRQLKEQKTIAMLVDQKMNEGIKLPFMGHDAMTGEGLAKIALKCSYPIVPLQIVRVANQSKFIINIMPPLQLELANNYEENVAAIMLQVNQILAKWVDQHPEQWLWMHNRWHGRGKNV
jgi:KDO2-lipid IV(A) lauroyltransferase